MADQLSLRLDPRLPRLPDVIRPMLAMSAAEPFDAPDYLFEPRWGGRRTLACVEPVAISGRPAGIRLLDEDGRDLSRAVPELATIGERVEARSAVLDGELVAVDGAGRCDEAELAARLSGGHGRGLAFLAFDLIYLDGVPLLTRPLVRRRDLLRRVLHPSDSLVVVPALPDDGRALYEAIRLAGLAGVMARARSSPYLPGVRSRLWRWTPAAPVAAQATDVAPEADATPTAVESGVRTPVLGLIRRLPFGDDD